MAFYDLLIIGLVKILVIYSRASRTYLRWIGICISCKTIRWELIKHGSLTCGKRQARVVCVKMVVDAQKVQDEV